MAIELNVNRLNAETSSLLGDVAPGKGAGTGKALAALIGGESVTVTSGALTDLEALVAKLKSDSERTRFLMLMTSLSSIGQSLNEAQKSALEMGLALSDRLKALNEQLEVYEGDQSKSRSDLSVLQLKIETLKKQIEQAVKDGKEHNELVAESKRVREEIAAKEQKIAETDGKIAEVKNEIASVTSRISTIVRSIGENALKTIARELTALTPREEAESAEEARKEAEKVVANDPLKAIHDALDRIERDLADAIESNRVAMV